MHVAALVADAFAAAIRALPTGQVQYLLHAAALAVVNGDRANLFSQRYGPHTTCVNRWHKAGVWDLLQQAVPKAYDGDFQMIDSSSIRVHQHAADAQKKAMDPVAWVARAAG
jgi:transposase